MNFYTLQRKLQEFELEIFTLNDILKISEQSRDVVKVKLSRFVKQEKIFRLKKGFYSLKKIEIKYQLQRIFNDTYVGLNSAMEYYGSTTQRFNNLDLITKKALNNQKIKDTEIQFHKVKKDFFFGYEKISVNKTQLLISSVEKTIIDCIYFSSKIYLTDIYDFIKMNKEKINNEILNIYLKKINSSTLNKRTGYLLELNGINLEGLKMNNKYEKLNKNLSNKGIKNQTWKLIINEDLENGEN
ncbi:MAG: hypothetical protein K8R54_10080 [Bacteroidales bacterium]|nr:hypothetical protein [Bacteroidales bacterium]